MAEMDIHEILKYLPQRYPILMIDRVQRMRAGQAHRRAEERVGERAVFPGPLSRPADHARRADPRGDGAGRRRAGVQRRRCHAARASNSVYYFVGIDNARFKKPVVPGDQLELEVTLERALRGIGKFGCVARVDGEVVAEADILCSVRPADA